ncbi:phosphoribosylglycinamide formyltransferase [Thiothrix nivea]|uniref:Phosphoribosylglycinamide formyltransferase n=1 Tax=Thiothrix nivea (strain ATCC 35100 / DSM 5205 / JP2) TaxID=870187 RepID=A0A656HDB8_THINJ|nr:phosphoribosylglycinamide formyltransferase [Thiothrix nivea]EIJ33169.1 formyltetrahydrofolate-dependent phosphoribosylglycinamide formyltransferase [Thiothrix nivea DSM 5205]
MSIDEKAALPTLVVLISGNGSNLQAIIEAIRAGRIAARVAAVISNRVDAYGLQRAADAGIPTETLDHTAFASREAFDQALQERVDSFHPDLVVLAGFMRIFTPGFVQHFAGRMLNIHPSLLPLYKGIHTHRRVLEDGGNEHGVSVHFVTPELDGGPVIMQAKVPVLPSDTEERLAQRVHVQEHVIYPRVVKWFVEGRLKLENGQALLDGKILHQPVLHLGS